METAFIYIILLLGLLTTFLTTSRKVQQVLFGFIGISLVWTTKVGFEKTDGSFEILLVITSIIALGMLAAAVIRKYAPFITVVGSLLPLILVNKTTHFFGFEIHWTTTIALIPFIGVLIPLIAKLKARLLVRWLRGNRERISVGITVFIAALGVFFATFQAQYLGVILLGSGWLAIGLSLRKSNAIAGGIALLSLGFLFTILKLNPSVDTSFMRGNFLMGLIAGTGAMTWPVLTKGITRFKWLTSYLLPVLIVTIFIFFGKANANFGGIPAYAGTLLGTILVAFTTRFGAIVIPVNALLIGLSIPVLSAFQEVTEVKKTKVIIESTAESSSEPSAPKFTSIALSPSMSGDWKINMAASEVNFQLGPEGGITKGKVEELEVTLKMNAAGEPEKINVSIPTVKISTLNSMRDATVHGAAYLDAVKFPEMNYTSSAFTKQGDKYLVSGNFAMLGKKQPLNLEVQFVKSGTENGKDYLILVGSSSLDRTKHGMKSDSKIGDIVQVNFVLELRKP